MLCCKVYDGDTITIITKLRLFGPKYKFSLRLRGIDAPEMKTKMFMKKVAIKSRDWLSNKILEKNYNKNLTEKYGRLLADIFYKNKVSLNKQLANNKLTVIYDGGKEKNKLEKFL